MKTQALIDLLAQDAGPAPRRVAAQRLWPAVFVGLVFSVAVAVGVLGMLPLEAFAGPSPWFKLVYAGVLAAAAASWAARLGRPLMHTQLSARLVVATLAVMALVGLVSWLLQPDGQRLQALMGQTAMTCPALVFGLSLPALAGTLIAMRGLAPLRPVPAGLAAGLLAGAVGALGYSLHCPEQSAAFVAVWYTLGMALTAALGALLGPWVLRW